jgi:dihydroxyacetone kinase-like protein
MSELTTSIRSVCEEVLDRRDELNQLDGLAGDGDLGVTAGVAANAVLDLLPSLEEAPLGKVLRQCGGVIAREAPSTSGTLAATALLRAGTAASSAEVIRVHELLEAADGGIADRGKAELGAKTIRDALSPAARAAASTTDVAAALAAAAGAADAGARATASMVPQHGRAGWLAERSMGHEDAGARLVAIILSAAARAAER